MRSNRAELALLRGKRNTEALELWGQTFAQGDAKKARRYALAITTFLGHTPPEESADYDQYLGHFSPSTRIAYTYAVTEFFEWIAAKRKRVVSPEEVTRVDTEEYVTWLSGRPFSLAEEKLKDGDLSHLLALFKIVEEVGVVNLQGIIDALKPTQERHYFGSQEKNREFNRRRVSTDVRQLVTMDVLTATPTLKTLRQEFPQAGITQWKLPLGKRGKLVNLEDVFEYSVKEYAGASRTTIAQRVSALSSFWRTMMQGENVSGGEPLLQYNVWESVKRRVQRGLQSYKTASSRAQKMPSEAVIRMLKDVPDRTLVQKRNKALLYLMVFAGLRTTELLQLRRGKPEKSSYKAWFDGSEPPSLQLVRKGGKLMRLPYPPVALKPLIEFQHALEQQSASGFAQYDNPAGDNYEPRESTAWYYRDLQLPEAPLFPPLALWGHNTKKDYRKSMSRVQCFRILKRIAQDVRLSPEEVELVHPHAIRHFAANAMLEGGKDIREVQAILGHSSVTTTETYLEDIDAEVRLSGQQAILDYLQARGVPIQPTYEGEPPPVQKGQRVVIETRGEPSDLSEVVTNEELEVLEALTPEEVPTHGLFEAPPDYDPQVVAMAMPGEAPPILETDEGLVGVEGTHSTEELLEDLAQTVRDGQSPGSPSWVYEAMADPKATHETLIFNRGGERDIDWLLAHYPRMPKNFGVGHESYLPWYVRARGNISRGGYFRGRPPFPVFSPEQCNPETTEGEKFLTRIETAYSRFVHGDTERGIAPSPLRSIGMVRWYSFFVYHATRYEEELDKVVNAARPEWHPWDAVVDLRNVRAHEDAWLVQWLVDNAHTYRASVDAMKRGVSRTEEDHTASFLKSSFEGVELITDVPEWMIYDDPVKSLYESDRRQWAKMIRWLKNVTGQQLEALRKIEREEQEEDALEQQKVKARTVRDVLTSVIRLVDQLSRAKHTARERVTELREQLRTQLYWYATAAGGVPRLKRSLDELKTVSTREFNKAMSEEYARLGIPDPNGEKYRKLKGKKRVAAIVVALFPEIPELLDGNVFAESKLFDPRWFRIDEKEHTIYIEPSERDRLTRQFGQNPELLVRRSARAMWESREKGYEALWGIMMSYFSWIVPTGKEMESQVLGIPVVDLGDEELNVEARKNWLKAWTARMKDLAQGKKLEAPDEEVLEAERQATEESLEPWQKFLLEEEGKTGEDALDRIAGDGVDFAMSASISGGYAESPEDIAMLMEEETFSDDYLSNPIRRRLRKNGKESFAYLEGERPTRWYQVDLFGRRKGHLRPNAPPSFISPGVVYRSQKKVFAARQLLPSPFRMIAGMDLAAS